MEITEEIRKIQGIMGNHSYSLILPKQYAIGLGLSKGDYVRVRKIDRKLIIEKVSEVQ